MAASDPSPAPRELLHLETDRLAFTLSRVGPAAEPLPAADGEPPRPGHLALEPRREDLELRVRRWPGSEEGRPPPRLFEDTRYQVLLRARGDHAVSLEHRDPTLLAGLTAEEGARVLHGALDLGPRPGRTRFTLRVDDRPELDLELEVFPSRLDYERDYRELVDEVQSILTGLALDFLRATYLAGGAVRVPRASSLEWLTLLSRVAGDLERSLQQVAARPIRGLSRAPVRTRVDRIRRVDSSLRAAVRRGTGAGGWRQLPGGVHVRELLDERRARPTLDTPEHRWLAQQLREIRRRLEELRRQERAAGDPERGERVHRQLHRLARRIGRLERLEPLAASRGPPPASFASLQLLGAPGYREAYRTCMVLSLGLRIEGGPWSLTLQDLHRLYRDWTFLALVRLLAGRLGLPRPAPGMFRVQRTGLRVELARGEKSAVRFALPGGGAVTVTHDPALIPSPLAPDALPDLLVEVEAPGRPRLRAALDGRYALDTTAAYASRHGHAGPPEARLARLHAYRDGVGDPRTPGHYGLERAVCLYPARRPELAEVERGTLARALDDRGAGALPALPGDTAMLEAWLDRLLMEHAGRPSQAASAPGSTRPPGTVAPVDGRGPRPGSSRDAAEPP